MNTLRQRHQALTRLHGSIRACTLCLDAGHPIVPCGIVRGRIGARVMIIGQAPGITEVEAGRPFNAGSGKRLFQWLGEAGFEETSFRATEYMTAITKCYPGRSRNGGGDRVPSRAEQALCRPYLDLELALVDPRLILPVGKLAIGLFFDKRKPLREVIGRRVEQDGRVIIPLPHPSGASRWHHKEANKALLSKAIAHICGERIALSL